MKPIMLEIILRKYDCEGDVHLKMFALKLASILGTCLVLGKKKMAYHLYSGIFLFVLMFRPVELLLYLCLLCADLFMMKVIKNRTLRTYAILLSNLAVIVAGANYGHRLGINVGGIESISSDVMLLAVKMYFLCSETTHTIVDCLRYIFFVPSLAFGPAVPCEELRKRVIRRPHIMAEKVAQTLLFVCVYCGGKKWVDSLNVTGPSDSNLGLKILRLYAYTLHYRTKYYFIWAFSSMCFYACGFKISNLRFLDVELAPTLGHATSFWNYYAIRFFRRSCFLRLKPYNKFFAAIVTSLLSATWHGGRPCDFMFVLPLAVAIPILKNNSSIMKQYLSRYVYLPLTTLQSIFFVAYIPVPFYFNSVKTGMKVWKNIYYVGHFYVLASVVFQLCVGTKKHLKKEGVEEDHSTRVPIQ